MKRHAGLALQMSDSELLTIAIAAQWRVGVRNRAGYSAHAQLVNHAEDAQASQACGIYGRFCLLAALGRRRCATL